MYDFSRHHINYCKLKKYYLTHQKEIGEIIKKFTKDELCKIHCQLNCSQWDETVLGNFRGERFAAALMFAIDDKVGHYEILRYCNVVFYKRMTEDDFFKWAVRFCFDAMYRSNCPLY